MKKYIKFEIQERKYSSNALIGIYMENGKEQREVIFVPLSMKKDVGDKWTIKLQKYLTEELNGN